MCVLRDGGAILLGLTVVSDAQTGQNWFGADPANDHFLALNLIT